MKARPTAAVCANAGNLGQALAYSGRARGVAVTVVAGRSANAGKIDRIRGLSAVVELVEGDIENARERAREIAARGDAFLVEDSENLDTCQGAGTIGLKLLDGFDRIDTILLALGGGALATGVGHVVKTLSPTTEVVCVQPKGAPAMAMSWQAGSIVTTDRICTIADGVAGRFPIPAVLGDLLAVADHVPLVEEQSIVEGMRMLYRHAALVIGAFGRPRRRGTAGRPLGVPRQARGHGDLRFECPGRFIQLMDARAPGFNGRRGQLFDGRFMCGCIAENRNLCYTFLFDELMTRRLEASKIGSGEGGRD